ncbi:uncharacterized protein Bfra_010438 [Botrytis fragariae]|uniref:Uncharacterized protein n=1 Tax=Botrytis fragariae TaxID=1964551 RepID=A0A8H6ECD2_9HELO|nr:uncharacterized protein Bfra_010438 [Botrytis fragariae]KAF5867464.1 hypothetical protein Bfra_010438 [Botrytis fragariae]
MFSNLESRLRRAMDSRRGKRETYKETENNELVHQSISTSETAKATNPALKTLEQPNADPTSIKVEIVLMDEKSERKARPPHKRTDKIDRSQQQLLLLKQKDPAEEVYPSLRLSSELSMDIYTSGDMIEDMNEEELPYTSSSAPSAHLTHNILHLITWELP